MTVCLKRVYAFLALLTMLLPTSRACPRVCVCKWKNGKQTVECNNKELLAIPEGMDPGTQVLEFDDNNLQMLTKEKFLKMDLINLQRIYFARCRISTIDDNTFKGLTNLVELDLSGNMLAQVPSQTFIDCPSLMKLTLSFNPIKALPRAAFSYLSYLNTLELSNCDISHVEEYAFQGLHSLEWLRMGGNKLTTIKGNRILPQSLKGAELHNNPWECDCHIVQLHTWLLEFNIPISMAPICQGPTRLSGRSVRSVPTPELACLPDVSPTTFYLEISEGKNLSLLCHVHASPEARVSWLFQGRVLQNDSLVAPGLHLLYYIDEGTDEKRSELFIYNTNTEDNGTFICSAENAAGISQSNFTIRIIVKEEPIVIIVSFPFEYLLAVVVGASVLLVFVIIMVILSILKCRKNRKRQHKREKTKEVALQYQHNTASKCLVFRENVEQFDDSLKETNNSRDRQNQELMYPHPQNELLQAMPPFAATNHVKSPASLKQYQLEQNPDLINDTEGGGRRHEGDGEDESSAMDPTIQQGFIRIPYITGSSELFTDVHLNPNCLMDTEGYPIDYGLPKMHVIPSKQCDSFYRTLPYNRGHKRQSAANPINRFSREAEFLSRSSQPAAYEHYCVGIRYTAEGYPPCGTNPPQSQGYKVESIAPLSLPCCTTSGVQWPHCVPANLHPQADYKKSKVTKRCVGAQTDNGDNETEESQNVTLGKTESAADIQGDAFNEVLTESPDEGYGGEPSVV